MIRRSHILNTEKSEFDLKLLHWSERKVETLSEPWPMKGVRLAERGWVLGASQAGHPSLDGCLWLGVEEKARGKGT